MMTGAEHFLKCCNSLKCFLDTIFEQSPHTVLARHPANLLGGLPIKSHFPNYGVHFQHFEYPQATPEAGLVAIRASFAAKESRLGDLIRGDARVNDFRFGRLVRFFTLCAV